MLGVEFMLKAGEGDQQVSPERGMNWWTPSRKGAGLAGQGSRGWGRLRGLVPFHGERAAEIGTDGEAAV
jgi:hypothetical protein